MRARETQERHERETRGREKERDTTQRLRYNPEERERNLRDDTTLSRKNSNLF